MEIRTRFVLVTVLSWASLAAGIAGPLLLVWVRQYVAVGPPFDQCGNSRNGSSLPVVAMFLEFAAIAGGIVTLVLGSRLRMRAWLPGVFAIAAGAMGYMVVVVLAMLTFGLEC